MKRTISFIVRVETEDDEFTTAQLRDEIQSNLESVLRIHEIYSEDKRKVTVEIAAITERRPNAYLPSRHPKRTS